MEHNNTNHAKLGNCRASWRTLANNANTKDRPPAPLGCAACVFKNDQIVILTVSMDLFRFDSKTNNWAKKSPWPRDKKPYPSKTDFILVSDNIYIYVVGGKLTIDQTNSCPVFNTIMPGTKDKKATNDIILIEPNKSQRARVLHQNDGYPIFNPMAWIHEEQRGVIVNTRTLNFVINAESQHTVTPMPAQLSENQAEAIISYKFTPHQTELVDMTHNTKNRRPHRINFNFAFDLKKMVFAILPEFKPSPIIQNLHYVGEFNSIKDLPLKRYLLKYKNWLILLGVDILPEESCSVKTLRLWVIDFEYELTQLDCYGRNYKLNWREVVLEGNMPQLTCVHAVNIITNYVYIFASYGEQIGSADMFCLHLHGLDNMSMLAPVDNRTTGEGQHLLYLSKNYVPFAGIYMPELSAPVLVQTPQVSHRENNKTAPHELLQTPNQLSQQNKVLTIQIAEMEKAHKEAATQSSKLLLEKFSKVSELENEKSISTQMYAMAIQEKQEKVDSLEKEIKQLKKEVQNGVYQLSKAQSQIENNEHNNKVAHQNLCNKYENDMMVQTDHLKSIIIERDKLLGVGLESSSLTDLEKLYETLKISKSKVKHKLIEKKENLMCLTCLENPKDMVFIPCGHLCICKRCFDKNNIDVCMICRSKGTVHKIFM